jgi:hypothetical protein
VKTWSAEDRVIGELIRQLLHDKVDDPAWFENNVYWDVVHQIRHDHISSAAITMKVELKKPYIDALKKVSDQQKVIRKLNGKKSK